MCEGLGGGGESETGGSEDGEGMGAWVSKGGGLEGDAEGVFSLTLVGQGRLGRR